jgi:alkanesulfonate monooxygenase SsuD/methylene tetrahydromethanopterin reductase-like flavin-dependent oxidoreductase (luciferase family)
VRQRNPIQTAKLGALVDQVSNGRFLFGVGGGWNRMKWRTTGTVFESRFKAMRERTDAMRENRQMARDAGRNPETLPVTLFNPARMRANSRAMATWVSPAWSRCCPRKRATRSADPRPLGRADPPHLALILSARSLHPRAAGK